MMTCKIPARSAEGFLNIETDTCTDQISTNSEKSTADRRLSLLKQFLGFFTKELPQTYFFISSYLLSFSLLRPLPPPLFSNLYSFSPTTSISPCNSSHYSSILSSNNSHYPSLPPPFSNCSHYPSLPPPPLTAALILISHLPL
jgi:hypothetical protein